MTGRNNRKLFHAAFGINCKKKKKRTRKAIKAEKALHLMTNKNDPRNVATVYRRNT